MRTVISQSLNLVERQDWITSRCGMIWSVAPVSAPLKAWNGEPGSRLIATGAPVIAACFAGSVYITKRLSAKAGRTIDWEMMVRMGHSHRLQNLETPASARRPRPVAARCPLGDYIAPIRPVSSRFVRAEPESRQVYTAAMNLFLAELGQAVALASFSLQPVCRRVHGLQTCMGLFLSSGCFGLLPV